jgi:hypothetical protein
MTPLSIFSCVNEMSMNLMLDCLSFMSRLEKQIVKINPISQKALLNYLMFFFLAQKKSDVFSFRYIKTILLLSYLRQCRYWKFPKLHYDCRHPKDQIPRVQVTGQDKTRGIQITRSRVTITSA